jgi:sensor histidine kinase YesM
MKDNVNLAINALPTVTNPLTYKSNFQYLILTLLALIGLQTWGLNRFLGLQFTQTSIDATVSWFLLGIMVYFATNTLSFYYPKRGKVWLTLISAGLIAFVWLKLSTLISSYFIQEEAYTLFLDHSQFFRFTVSFLIVGFTISIYLIWNQLMEKEDLQRRKEEMETMAKEAELFKLRHQLQPHFLFNSLNSINSLIGSQTETARKMVQQLSDFLRGTVKREDQKLVSLKEELDYLKLYLDIEQVRFGHRLEVQIDCKEESLDHKLPTLILQPLLENAVKFGLYGTVGEVVISVSSQLINNRLHIHIKNPFDEDMQAPPGTGFGLSSVQRRLYLLYGRKDLIQTSVESSHFNVYLKFPTSL